MIRQTIDGLSYDAGNKFYWDKNVNPGATVKLGLPDCTTAAYGLVLEGGLPAPVSKSYGEAGEWHLYLINGWIAAPYNEYKGNIKVGDIIEWSKGNHVAVVSSLSGGIKVSASFYTGIHGKAYYGNDYDTREGINSLKELNDFFYNKYQYRFFHFVDVNEESKWCGHEPDYVLIAPLTIVPVPKDPTKNQVYVGISGLRIRKEASTESLVEGIASVGYYNAEKVTGSFWEDRGNTGNTWYKIGEHYIAAIEGVQYYPTGGTDPVQQIDALVKQLVSQIDALKVENATLKDKLERVKEIVC